MSEPTTVATAAAIPAAPSSPTESAQPSFLDGLNDALRRSDAGETVAERVETPTSKEPVKVEVKPDATTETSKTKENQVPWAKLKEKANKWDEAEPKLTAYEQQIKDWEAKHQEAIEAREKLAKEYEPLTKEATELRTWKSAFDLTNTPLYQSKVAVPFAQAQESIGKLAERFGIDGDKLWEAATETDEVSQAEAIFELLADHEKGPIITNLLNKQIATLQNVAKEHDAQVAHSEGLRNQLAAAKQTKEREMTVAQQQEYKAARDETWKILKQTVPELFDSKDSEVQKLLSSAETAEFTDTPMERSLAARLPALLSATVGQLRLAQEQIRQKEATIAEIAGARGSGSLGKTSPTEATAPSVSFAEGLKQAMDKARRGG